MSPSSISPEGVSFTGGSCVATKRHGEGVANGFDRSSEAIVFAGPAMTGVVIADTVSTTAASLPNIVIVSPFCIHSAILPTLLS